MVKKPLEIFRSPDVEAYSQIVIEQITIASNETLEGNSSSSQRENSAVKIGENRLKFYR